MSKQVFDLYKLGAASGYILDIADGLPYHPKYFGKLKQTAKSFLRELEKVEATITNGAEDEAVQQLVDSYGLFNNMINLVLSIKDKKKKSFERELNELIKKYESTKTSDSK
jgi:hypothetical protein